MELIEGIFINTLKHKNNYTDKELIAMHETVSKLINISTNENKPGMLLGRIQSGKTRSFMGSMAMGFDNGYDVVIILTKNSNALARQTYERLQKEYEELIDTDYISAYDIMTLPEDLRKFELNKKLVIVVKKEKKNVERLSKALFETYPVLSQRQLMIIDDEADYASVVYDKDKDKNLTELKIIASQLDQIKRNVPTAAYLQVTATPYSLYLQPDSEVLEARGYQPKRPAFTVLVPTFDGYVGGQFYFEQSKLEHPARYVYQPISDTELEILRKEDNRRAKDDYLLTSKNFNGLRKAIINFVVGGKIRNLQQLHHQERPKKYAFIMHTITTKRAHEWQYKLVLKIERKLMELLKSDEVAFKNLIQTSYDDFRQSTVSSYFPGINEVYQAVKNAFLDEELLISIVNSENDVNQLLDKAGELKLRAPLNFFIGGQILDRGITIGNLIGFYYGRDPKKFQQDTVLQHSRMYGARPKDDLYVTRFYTTHRIYDVMERMHQFDEDLRSAFESGRNAREVVFMKHDTNKEILPCNPNKLLLSKVITIKAKKRFLPIGFQTKSKSEMTRLMKKIDTAISKLRQYAIKQNAQDTRHILVPIEKVIPILINIHETIVMEEGYEWNIETYTAILNYLSKLSTKDRGYVWVIIRDNRNISRYRLDGIRFADRPDNGQDELTQSYKLGTTHPTLMLLRQNGDEAQGWRGGAFYWPVIVAPTKLSTVVFEG
ncbi:Z1 domain-containing protein [Macrococcus animalis]|uniref:Z1 domain-containing protein n=1 Tax=Macrococcus animalis TaxID=3395467 RepID=UPI0039BE3151